MRIQKAGHSPKSRVSQEPNKLRLLQTRRNLNLPPRGPSDCIELKNLERLFPCRSQLHSRAPWPDKPFSEQVGRRLVRGWPSFGLKIVGQILTISFGACG